VLLNKAADRTLSRHWHRDQITLYHYKSYNSNRDLAKSLGCRLKAGSLSLIEIKLLAPHTQTEQNEN